MVLLLGRPVDLVLPVAVHPHVDVEDEHLRIRQQLADLDGLLRRHRAAHLRAVLVAYLTVTAAHTLDEADPFRRLAVGRAQHPVLRQHRLEVRLSDDVGELVVPVHLGRPARVEVAEPGGDDDRAALERLRADGLGLGRLGAAQRQGELPGLPHHAGKLGTESDSDERIGSDQVDHLPDLRLCGLIARSQAGIALRYRVSEDIHHLKSRVRA